MKPESRELQSSKPSTLNAPARPVHAAPALPVPYAWDPFVAVAEFDRNFQQMRRNMESMLLPSWWATESRPWTAPVPLDQPRSDFFEEPEAFVAVLELPGFSPKEVDVQVTENRLTVEAHHEEERGPEKTRRGYFAHERQQTAMVREFALPAEVVPNSVHAEFKDGVLTVRCPKSEPTPTAKPWHVKVE